MFSNMGVEKISKDRNLIIKFGDSNSDTQQIDTLIIDEGVAIVVECKTSETENKKQGLIGCGGRI